MKRSTVTLFLLACLILPVSVEADLTVSLTQTDGNGVSWYEATSTNNGPGVTTLRVLRPTTPAGVPRRIIYVLPVTPGVDLGGEFGDGLEALRALNVHNQYNAEIVAPSFANAPWYANHDSNLERQYEEFMVQDLVPWVQANLAVTGLEEHWLIGFSKSGFGVVTLLMRNPSVFHAAAAWDFPADQADASQFDMLENYGTTANFEANYRLTSEWIASRRDPFLTGPRLWLSQDFGTVNGGDTFRDQVLSFADRLQANDVEYTLTGGAARIHHWASGWLLEAVAALQGMRFTVRDDFDRPDGALGLNWTRDPGWGAGVTISGNDVGGLLGEAGAHYWSGSVVGADQYSQITLTGVIGDWTGVVVRASVTPSQGYWAAVKPDGVYLYAYVGNVFYLLGHDAENWATGDVLRLAVRTVGASTVRLTVYRNGAVVFTVDEAAHFIADGRPGIGLYAASAAVALDTWEAGPVSVDPPAIPRDDFDRPDGVLGPNWTRDPGWGAGVTISGNDVGGLLGEAGAHYWSGSVVGADQYSQITLTGVIGDWTGVVVRASVTPSQGYWAAVKPDGVYLYAYVGNVFYLLGHDAENWATGDVLRLAVRTVGVGAARLTVFRNGWVLFTVDAPAHFIADGRPGIGLHAGSAAVALDTWEAGPVSVDPPAIPRDDFDRPDGALGLNWTRDPGWGAGVTISGNDVGGLLGEVGAHYWSGSVVGADQYSQITLTGVIGDWTGVVVRASVTPSQGYWAAVKPDGVYLYAYVGNVFYLLGHDAENWATGDVLRLAVRTVGASTVRLTVYRNGAVVFTVDEAAHFIADGRPGIGLYAASAAVALDTWEAGPVSVDPPAIPRDDFDRPDGVLGPNWTRDPGWGAGVTISGNDVGGLLGEAGAHYWSGSVVGADQYSQITLTGVIGDWTGVVVRASVTPSQGYWAAVKPDGVYLYAYVGNVFYLLGHDAENWATGDVLRLAVQTVGASTARLTVSRNGSVLFAVDDGSHFIADGQPGIGLYASAAVALDAWEGGVLPVTP